MADGEDQRTGNAPRKRREPPAQTGDRIAAAVTSVLADWLAKGLAPGLHLVATPIGNLGDMSPRALAALATADQVYCEDTRTSRSLLVRFAIDRPLKAYHEHSRETVRDEIVAAATGGQSVVVISDAGMPAISDPGFKLARAVIAAGGDVFAIPGPTAATAALAVAGLPTDSFFFAGFLPQKGPARRTRIAALAGIPATLVIYESPHRLTAALDDLAAGLGRREGAVVRELTKKFEEVYRGALEDLASWSRDIAPRGEIAIVIAPPSSDVKQDVDDATILDAIAEALRTSRPSRAARDVAERLGVPRARVYQLSLRLRGGSE
jgi:16S rRNA (cytidine1402-2'-O)-methyltransferase